MRCCESGLQKIESSGFSEYYFETTLQTYLQYPGAENTQSTALQGIKDKIWVPQFHAREHIQSNKYLCALQSGVNYLQALLRLK